jgi:hypothetical protein
MMMKHLKSVILFSWLAITSSVFMSGCGGAGAASTNIVGKISGLTPGSTVDLQNNGGDTLIVGANGDFAFSGQVKAGSTYLVTVSADPIAQTCTVTNGSGTVGQYSEDVTNVVVTCAAANGSVLGVVSGLASGATLTLEDQASIYSGVTPDSITISADGVFVFPISRTPGNTYNVIVTTPPVGQTCSVTNGTGTIPETGGIVAVLIACK